MELLWKWSRLTQISFWNRKYREVCIWTWNQVFQKVHAHNSREVTLLFRGGKLIYVLVFPQLRQHTLQPQLPLISLRFSCLTTISKNDHTAKTDVDLSVHQMYSFHIFADTVPHLACWNLVSVLHSWCVSERLTFADLCPSWFMGLILTLRMTASVNCTSVCPLTQRPARLLSKVRSGSDYNPFPSLLWVSFATSWQQLFHLISLEIATSHRRQGHLCGDPASISKALFDWVL